MGPAAARAKLKDAAAAADKALDEGLWLLCECSVASARVGGGVGNGYEVLKGAAGYVPGNFDDAAGSVAIDMLKSKDVRPEKTDDP